MRDFNDNVTKASFPKQKKETRLIIKEILEYILVMEVVFAIFVFVLMSVRVNGPSMVPNLVDGDRGIMLRKTFYNQPGYNKVVVIDDLGEFNLENDIVKRVIGLPNDYVEIKDNAIYINGKLFDDKYRASDTQMSDYSIQLKDKEYFVLGDNRNISYDSRALGAISYEQIIAVNGFMYWSFDSFGFK
ncbi:MAG: signal peptidase I [Bacilli bacterium]